MAVKYRFPFESVEGQDWTIDILASGYSGSVKVRHLGGPPMLRKDKNENICGTSLDLTAECAVDGEFEEFSSSDPYAFQAKVYHGSSLVWQGFVSPELYSAPDIAPPYDVRVTATDGLGELKLHDFEAQGRKTLSALFTYLLDFTGLSLGFRQITDLSCSASGIGDMLTSVYVNIDYLAGETCYDVLQYLLATIHSTITQDGNYWLIQKETGITVIAGGSVACYNNGVSAQRGVPVFGSMRTKNIWPVGHMTREYVAPKKKMVVTADNHYRPNILSDSSWVLDGGTTDEGAYWELPNAGDGMTQTISFQQEVSKHLVLSIKVRNVGDGQDAGNLAVYVKLAGSHYQAGSYLYLTKVVGSYRRPGADWYWSTASATSDFEVQAPSETDTDQDYVTIDVRIPLYTNNARSYVRASSLEFQIFNGDQLYPKRIYGISLYQYEQTKGFRKVVNIDNGARGEAPDVSLVFPCSTGVNDYNGAEEMLYGMPVNSSGARITSWSTYNFSNMDFMSLIARDYAASYAAPRVRLSGALQIGGGSMPIMFIDSFDSVLYIIESFSWDLYNDEISVQMISKPNTSSITVDSESTEEGETENPMGHAQSDVSGTGGGGGGGSYTLPIASASTLGGVKVGSGLSIDNTGVLSATGGGGGGGGGSVTSVGVTASSEFDVTGSPVTGAGTIDVSLKSTYKIPTTAEWSVLSGVAHAHNNKSVLDGITAQKVSQWDAAAGGDTIDVSIGGTAAEPTVAVELGTGDNDSAPLPIADANKSGLVSTSAQKFSGSKTFDRIYLGNSAQYGMYIEWDDTNHMFKIVGDVYATGDVAAGG